MFKRPLIFAAISFVAGILVSAYKLNSSTLIAAAIILCVVSYLKTKSFRVCALALIIFLLGINAMSIAQSNRSKTQSQYAGKVANMELVVQEFSKNNKVIASFDDKGKPQKIHLTAPSQSVLYPGDIVKGEIAITAPAKAKTDVSDFSSYLASRGVFLQGYAKNLYVTGRKTDGFMGKIYSLRVFIDKVGEAHFSGNSRALFNAMVLGDKSLISGELSSALTASGLNHIAVVSGLHLSVVIALLMFFVHKIFGKRRIGYFFAVSGAVFIAFATGAGASVIRALIMCMLFLLSQILYRENDPLSSLSFAALSMLAANPFMIFNAGFVLSVLSVLGILLYSGKFTTIIGRLFPPYIASAVGVSISVHLTLTPALVYYFGIVTPYAIISNLLIASLAGAYVTLGIIFILLSWAGPLAIILGFFMKSMAQAILKVCYLISSLPFATVKIVNADMFLLLIWVFMAVLIYVYPVDRRKIIEITAFFSLISVYSSFLSGAF